MARQGVVAMDFLGVGEVENAPPQQIDRATMSVEPMPSLPAFKDPAQWRRPLVGGGGGTSSGGSSTVKWSQPQTPKGRAWPMQEGSGAGSVSGGAASGVVAAPPKPPSGSGGSEKSSLDKPLEELTEADIMQLTREDCRRYLKEKGMRRPSWNKFQAIQQVLSLKSLFDSKTPGGEKGSQKDDSPPAKDGAEGTADATLPLLSEEANGVHEQDVTGNAKEVHSFFGLATQGLGMPTEQKSGMFADGQNRPPQFVDEKGSAFPSNSTSLLPNSDLTLSLPSAWEKGPSPSNKGGFGSPLPMFPASKERPGSPFVQATSARNVQDRKPLPQGNQASTDAGTRPGSSSGRPPAAQLTIFYAGLVNVYEEVPAEKARAIMLLAGSGNQWSTSSLLRPLASVEHPLSAPPIVTTSPTIHSNSLAGELCKDGMSPSVFNPGVMNQGVRQRPHAELPQARKASLQRFLEKRKERVLSKAPYLLKKSDTEDSSACLDRACEISSSISKGFEPVSGSPLPPPQHSLSAAPSSWPSQSCGSENSSPLRAARAEEMALKNNKKRCAISEAEKECEKSETVNSGDEKMTEAEDDAASSQV